MVSRTAIRIDATPATSTLPNSLTSVSPLYNCLSNYNKTLIVRRSSDLSVGAIDIFGVYKPQDLLPIFITIIYKQFKENCELQAVGRLREIQGNRYELKETDDADDEDDKDDKDDKGNKEDDGDNEDDEDNNARRKRQRKEEDDQGRRDRGRGGNRGRRGRTRKGDERKGRQKGGSSGGASNMSLIKQDKTWMGKLGNRLHFVCSLLFR